MKAPSSAFVEAELTRLEKAIGLNPAQLDMVRGILAKGEDEVGADRKLLQEVFGRMESAKRENYAQIGDMLDEEQANKLWALIESGGLPLLINLSKEQLAAGKPAESGTGLRPANSAAKEAAGNKTPATDLKR